MATEEIGRHPPLPPYNPQLILEAIDVLNQKEGANISAISKYIESKYGDLPACHSNLLSVTLYAMKETGDIIFLDNNYLRPDVDYSVRLGRGCGRSSKPKDPLAVVSDTPKSRGRPKKDSNGPPGEVIFLKNNYLGSDPNNSPPRGRGRPSKPKVPLAEAAVGLQVPKSRGRPKKDPNAPSAPKKQKIDPVSVPVLVPFIGDEASPRVSKTERPRGRAVKASIPVSKTGRPRGRPMKVKPQAVMNGVSSKSRANLLSTTLYAMKKKGEVNLLKKKSLGPDQYNQASRSRGRPPTAKDPLAKSATVSYPPKSRGRGGGRPRKDLNVPPTPKKRKSDPIPVPFTDGEPSPPESKTGRPRSRSIKALPAVSKTGKPRGRPVKVSTPVSKTGKPRGGRSVKVSTPVSKTGKPRGKSVKAPTPVSKTGKPRGRPRKLKSQALLNGGVGIEGI